MCSGVSSSKNTGSGAPLTGETDGITKYTAIQAIGSVPTATEVFIIQNRLKLGAAADETAFQFWATDPAVSLGIISVLIRTRTAGVDAERVMASIAPTKDIEGIHPENLGRLVFGEHLPAPCAASAAVELAKVARPNFRGLEAVVVGRSALVGKAIAMLLLHSKKGAPTATICHTATADLGAVTRRADLLFAAAGRAHLVGGDMVKPGAVVIDVGINETPDGKLVGDVRFDEVKERAAVITPVPGGVGPVCTAILLRNLVGCSRLQTRS